MRKEIISYSTSTLAKERGFDELCEWLWFPKGEKIELGKTPNRNKEHQKGTGYSAPTHSHLQRWLRRLYNTHVEIYCNASGWGWILTKLNGTTIKEIEDDHFYETYTEALNVGLKEALKRIEE